MPWSSRPWSPGGAPAGIAYSPCPRGQPGHVESVDSVLSVQNVKICYLACDTIDLRAERTLEDVDIVVKDGPASTVRGLAVESVLHVGLGFLHRLLLVFLEDSGADQL